jgi:hypothetical protein
MKVSIFALMFAVLAGASSAQVDGPKQHAATTVAHLHDSMLDPASFVLDGAYVTKPNKKGAVSYCYVFRSHNTMGGYSEGRAVEDGSDHNDLSVYSHPAETGGWVGYDVGWVAPCKAKNIEREITADVATLAQTLYKKTK